jgi:glycosyltransferase involved in cell wall biosynthesis
VVARDKLAFYCTMFDRRLVSRIGLLDETFINGGEDFDYCYRAKKAGWSFESHYKSFVLHFGGKTRKVNEEENKERHQKEDKFNNSLLGRKLSKSMLVFYLGQGWERWDETNIISGGIGGSETAAIWMAREMAAIGYQVKVFADPPADHMDSSGADVEYINWEKYEKFAKSTYIDFLISSRTCEPFNKFMHAYRKYVWIHDVFINWDRNYNCHVDKVNYFLTLSDWHKDYVHQHHNIPKDKILVTTNGVDPTRYNKQIAKIPGQIVYSSSPDRGLDTLLYCSDFIKNYVPNLKILVAYGFDNWEKAVLVRKDQAEIKWMQSIKKDLQKPHVKYIGRVDQKNLAEIQQESSAWLYPTRFHETNCITAIENGFAKNPILATSLAGLITTVGDKGILLEGNAYDKEYREKFIEESIKLLTDNKYWNEWSEKSHTRMSKFTWKNVAAQWHKLFQDNVFERL